MDNITTKHLEDFISDNSFKEFVSGESKASVEKWLIWIKENPQALKEFETAIKVMKLLLKTKKQVPDIQTEEALNELLSAIRNNNGHTLENSSTSYQWWRIAAILIILVSVSAVLFFSLRRTGPIEISYNEIIVPLGEKSQVILSDGTHIWINSSSKLKYPVNFDKTNRVVYLEGEAFFDVKRNEKQSFVVNTPDLKVKVLGTAFNVKNYPGDKNAVTTVVRGLVSVEGKKDQSVAIYLKPNENYVLNTKPLVKNSTVKPEEKENLVVPQRIQPLINKHVNVEAVTSWKDQELVFVDEPMEDVALKMERWYNVKIHILNEDLKKIRYRGKFVNNETIYQVFEAIKFTTPIKYKFKNNEFFVDKPK